MSVQKPIVVVGSINTDLVAFTGRAPVAGETVVGSNFQVHPGGKGANQAVGVARLGYPVRLIGRLGNDSFGTDLRTYLQQANVDISGVSTSDGASGVAVIVVSGQGESRIVLAPGANAKVTPEDINANLSILRSAGMVLAQLEIPLEAIEYLASVCARENVPLVLDPAPARELSSSLFKKIAWFTPNQTEAGFYFGESNATPNLLTPAEMAEVFLSKGCQGVVLKMGSEGAYLGSQDGNGGFVRAFSVDAVDTTGAGDAFNAGFATACMLGKSALESATFASAVAAISVTRSGAQPSIPTMAEAERFMKNQLQQVMLSKGS